MSYEDKVLDVVTTYRQGKALRRILRRRETALLINFGQYAGVDPTDTAHYIVDTL
jgi:hypothetical protein